MAPAVMAPSLYLQIAQSFPGDPASGYAAVLTTTTVVAMAAPIPFGMWADRRGEREVYVGVTIGATLAALLLAVAPLVSISPLNLALFSLAWGTLSAPLSLRGVRAAFFARHVRPAELSRAGQLASAAGLVGSVVGPLLAAVSNELFLLAALFAAAAHAIAALALCTWLPTRLPARSSAAAGALGSGGSGGVSADGGVFCERCGIGLTEVERRWEAQLCDVCWDTWFRHFKRRTLVLFCGVAALLEFSMNATVVATFQPLAVEHFGWGSDQARRPLPPPALFSQV